jgi:RNA polymerase sigma-70 factor (ECF subfamily)
MFWGPIFLNAVLNGDGDSADKASDMMLVAAAQRGDADAFAKLHARYYRRIYHLAYLKTNNASDAEDVASETFIRALSGLRRFRFGAPGSGQTSFYPWLHRIAINLIIDSARQRPPSGIVSLDAPIVRGMRSLLGEQLTVESNSASPQEIVERHEVQQLVRSAIAALPADQGDVLIYRFLGELSIEEMAPLLQRSESAVKSLLHRAVVALRAEIERRLEAVERLEASREQTGQRSEEGLQRVGRTHR